MAKGALERGSVTNELAGIYLGSTGGTVNSSDNRVMRGVGRIHRLCKLSPFDDGILRGYVISVRAAFALVA